MRASLTLFALAALVAPAGAQQASADTSSIWDVLKLPQTVEEGRQAGVPAGSIWGVLDSLRRRGVPAADAGQIIQEEVEAVKAGAPADNFGASVNALLARGLRGRELAEAIHAEHARRGIGRGRAAASKGKGKGRKP
jgi:hypothetical protein